MKELTSKRRSELRAEAHKLSPLVIVGDKGLTENVIAEVDRALKAHELVKVRAATDDRAARGEWMKILCDKLDAHPVQQIGKVLVVYRENPKERSPEARPRPEADRKPGKRRIPPERNAKLAKRPPSATEERKSFKSRFPSEQRRTFAKRRLPEDAGRFGKRGPPEEGRKFPKAPDADARNTAKRTARPRSRTPSGPPESEPRRRRPRSSR
jgi:RNA-binding protein